MAGIRLRPILAATALAAVATYLLDVAWFQYRVAYSQSAYRTVQIRQSYAVPMKNGKLEYMFDPEPIAQRCTRTAFPQQGLIPCWYLAKHTNRQLDLR